MYFTDALTLDAPRRTRDGFMAVRAKAARVGVYDYLGSEIDPENRHGLRDKGVVKVLRDEATVFDKAAAQSFIGKPVTDDHPTQAVTADNWRQHARGTVMGAIRDGDYLAFDLLLTDADAIAKVDSGKRELSNGYAASLEFGDFAAPDGTKCVARQTSIQGNHVALVDRGRAGPECRISDAARCDSAPRSIFDSLTTDGAAEAIAWLKKAIALHKKHMDGTAPTTGSDGEKSQMLMMTQMKNALSELESGSSGKSMKMDQFTYGAPAMKTMLLDGIPVNLGDAAAVEAAIAKLQDTAAKAVAALTDAEAKLSTETGKVAALEKQLADAKAELEPARLDKLVADRAALVVKAKAIAPDLVTDGKTDVEIRRAVVVAKLGDACPADDAGVAGAFAVLASTKDAAPEVQNLAPAKFADTATVRDAIRAARYA